jgi:hypothetical protein
MYAKLQFPDFIMTRKKRDAKSIPGVAALIFLSRLLKNVNSVSVKSDLRNHSHFKLLQFISVASTYHGRVPGVVSYKLQVGCT